MEPIKCRCGKGLKSDMEVEYSHHLTEYFCSPDCATDKYFEHMRSCCVDFTQPLPEDVVVVDGVLVRIDQSAQRTCLKSPDGNHHFEPGKSLIICEYCGASR